MSFLYELRDTLRDKALAGFRAPGFLAVPLGIAIVSLVYVNSGADFVRFSGTATLRFEPGFGELQLLVRPHGARLDLSASRDPDLNLRPAPPGAAKGRSLPPIWSTSAAPGAPSIHLTEEDVPGNATHPITVRLRSANTRPVDIREGYARNRNLSAAELLPLFKNQPNVRLVTQRLVREDLSRLVHAHNEVVSNYLLAGMICGAFALMLHVGALLFLRAMPRTAFAKRLSRPTPYDAVDRLYRHDSALRFAQILGPALGFALTVSSLIAALAAIRIRSQDLVLFFDAVQVAMVSTLLGLLIRVLALSGERLNLSSVRRAEDLNLLREPDGTRS